MKRFYKLRKWIVERLGGTMSPLYFDPTVNIVPHQTETYCATHTEPRCTLYGEHEQEICRQLVHRVADMIYEKHAYRASVEQNYRDDWFAITVCVDVVRRGGMRNSR